MKLSSLGLSMFLVLAFLGASCGSNQDAKPQMTVSKTSDAKANPDALTPSAIALLESENLTLASEKEVLANQIKENEKKRVQAGKLIKGEGIGGILGTIIGVIVGGPNIIQNIADALTNKDGKKAIELINKDNLVVEGKIKACDEKIKLNKEKIAKAKALQTV